MPKLRRQRKRQRFQYGKNRRRGKQVVRNNTKKNVNGINCEVIRDNWDLRKSAGTNLSSMGLAVNPNSVLGLPGNDRLSLKDKLIRKTTGEVDEQTTQSSLTASKSHVVEALEKEAKASLEASRRSKFRFSEDDVLWMTSMMEKHGDDFEAMAKDAKNVFQLTTNQIRRKIGKFASIPRQFEKAAINKGIDAKEITAIVQNQFSSSSLSA